MKDPAKNPCGSCPYRKDVPSGVWDASEYEKLPEYDKETQDQPLGVFMCHQQNGRVCAGWAGCHDMDNNMALRFASIGNDIRGTLNYVSPIPLWESGQQARDHGIKNIENPGSKAMKIIDKMDGRKRT